MDSSAESATATPVLATTSIIFHVHGDPYADNEEVTAVMESVAEKLRAVLAEAFAGDPGVEVIGAVSFRYPGQEDANVYRCVRCGDWLTDSKLPSPCDGLMPGYLVNGEYLCTQHFEIAVDSGEIPMPEGYRVWRSGDEADVGDERGL